MSQSVLTVANTVDTKASKPLVLTPGKGTQYINATHGQRVIISEPQLSGKPGKLLIKRIGKNLQLSLSGDEEPLLVIYDYYSNEARLQGIGEDGLVHNLIINAKEEKPTELDEGDEAYVYLSSFSDNTSSLFVPEPTSSAWKAMTAFAGLLGIGGLIRVMQNQHSGPDEATPSAPHIIQAVDNVGSHTGILESNNVTDDAQPRFEGHLSQPGELITLYADGIIVGSTIVAEDGSWSLVPDFSLSHGLHDFYATATSVKVLLAAFQIFLNLTLI